MRHFLTTVGNLVSPEQAGLIIARTQKYPLQVDFPEYVSLVDKYLGSVPTLSLEYLHNYRIGSKQGVRGWMGWSGRVGCELLELPTAGHLDPYTITSDCKVIADAFPFLSMRLQVYQVHPRTVLRGTQLHLMGQWNVDAGGLSYLAPEDTAIWLPKEPLPSVMWRRGMEVDTVPPENYQLGASEKRLSETAKNIKCLLDA